MFYSLSKIFDFLVMPYNLLFIALIILFLRVKTRRLRNLVAIVFIGLYLQSNAYFAGQALRLWEYPPRSMDQLDRRYEVGIILSGGLLNSCGSSGGRFELEHGSDRLLTGYLLYKRGICRKLLLTGTDIESMLAQNRGEVQLAKKLLVEWGVDPADIILETRARNTRENALFTSELLKTVSSPGENLLITSAYHMRRAKACFDKAGVRTDVFPADSEYSPECLSLKKKLLPTPAAADVFNKIWREWIGMLTYKIAGYC